MQIVFRVDSALQIGSGHLMRCLTLATGLREKGATCVFICRSHPNNLNSLVRQKGFTVYELPQGTEPTSSEDLGVPPEVDAQQTQAALEKLGQVDWLVVDHYGIEANWEKAMRPWTKKIFIIDDLANRFHDCDVLLDQNYTLQQNRYSGLVPSNCSVLLGPRYALLRPEFIAAREKLEREGHLPFDPRKVFIFFGGTDPKNYTTKALEILRPIGDFSPEVVIGANHLYQDQVAKQIRYFPNGKLHIKTDKIAEIMSRCCWYFGSGGSITWERMCLGLTGIVFPVADNQFEFSKALHQQGLQKTVSSLCLEQVRAAYNDFICADMRHIGRQCRQLVTGEGVSLVISELERG